MKIVTIIGARPQFIKAAAVSRILDVASGVDEVLVHTGQHYDENMSDVFFEELGIPRPAYTLGIGSGNHGMQTGRMLGAVEEVILEEEPDWVMVYGDTNSTLAGALAAVKLHIPVAHVEAGLRSFNRRMPEEVNRVLTDYSSTLLLAPTEEAVRNLRNEGISKDRVHLVGDVMYDAALFFGERAERESRILNHLELEPKSYVLATVHRAENTGHPERLSAILEGLSDVGKEMPVVLPLHPRTRAIMERNGLLASASRAIRLIDPVGYLDMVALERSARLIATDSGGVQKEAFFHRVPCVTLRNETEWVELLELGWNRLAPPVSAAAVVGAVREALDSSPMPPRQENSPYGNGKTAEEIVQLLMEWPGENLDH